MVKMIQTKTDTKEEDTDMTEKRTGILINEKNKEKLEAMIEEGQKKGRTRTITLDYIIKHLELVEKHLNIPKTRMIGVRVSVDPWAQNFPSAYRWTPMSTQFNAEYTRNGWKLKWVGRHKVETARHETEIYLTDAAREAILRRMTTCVLD